MIKRPKKYTRKGGTAQYTLYMGSRILPRVNFVTFVNKKATKEDVSDTLDFKTGPTDYQKKNCLHHPIWFAKKYSPFITTEITTVSTPEKTIDRTLKLHI